MPLREAILEACERLPTGGGYRFQPSARIGRDNPRDPLYDGVSQDLLHQGQVVARAAADGATYCCGVTFEAWWLVCGERLGSWAADDVRALITEWFCPTIGHPGVASALVARDLADPVEEREALPGDLCQFWRSVDLTRPSGHSVVWLGWGRDPRGRRTTRYWSSQPATAGVGAHEEVIGEAWRIHVVRPRWHR